MFSSTQENRFNTKYTVSTTGLGLFPVTVSIIKCTLIGRLLWSGVHIESGKSILFKITGNSQLSHARKKKEKKKAPISISLCITWKFRLAKHSQYMRVLHREGYRIYTHLSGETRRNLQPMSEQKKYY